MLYDFATERLDREERSEAFLEEPFYAEEEPIHRYGIWQVVGRLRGALVANRGGPRKGRLCGFRQLSWLGPRRTEACRIAGLTYGFAPARLARINDAGEELRSAGDAAPRPKQTGRYGCIHRPRASHDRMLLRQLC